MQKLALAASVLTIALEVTAGSASAQTVPATSAPVGNPLGLPVLPVAGTPFKPMSSNVKVFGSVYSAESCSYDAERGVIVIPNRGAPQTVRANDAWITFLNHDGSVHTSRWIGVQNAGSQRDSLSPPLVLNEPYGSDIVNGVLYLADRDGGMAADVPSTFVIRRFDMKTGAALAGIPVSGAPFVNDIAVDTDGTIYATATGAGQLWRVRAGEQATVFASGAHLNRPNGIALDRQRHIVVVNSGGDSVLTFSHEGAVLRTERAAQAGSDGIVIMEDGTKYVSSVYNGGVSRIRPGRPAELIAENIPTAASMCYDAGAKQLVIPMNENNGVAFIKVP